MAQIEACLFSPFSPHLVKQENYCALLLQFFLKELLAAHQAILHKAPAQLIISPERRHFPYDWAKESGHINKAREHAQLLLIAFAHVEKSVEQIHSILTDLIVQFSGIDSLTSKNHLHLKKKLHQIYHLTEPLVQRFKNNENLIFFLLKNQGSINALAGKGRLLDFLSELHKKKLGQLEKKLSDHYHERGFFSLIPELRQLFSELGQ